VQFNYHGLRAVDDWHRGMSIDLPTAACHIADMPTTFALPALFLWIRVHIIW